MKQAFLEEWDSVFASDICKFEEYELQVATASYMTKQDAVCQRYMQNKRDGNRDK